MKKGQVIATAAAALLAVSMAAGISGCTNGAPGLNCPNSCKGMSSCKSTDIKDAGVVTQEVKTVVVHKTIKTRKHHHGKKRKHKAKKKADAAASTTATATATTSDSAAAAQAPTEKK